MTTAIHCEITYWPKIEDKDPEPGWYAVTDASGDWYGDPDGPYATALEALEALTNDYRQWCNEDKAP